MVLLMACGADDSSAADQFNISGVPSSGVRPGETYVFRPRLDGQPSGTVVYSISHVPTWATFDPATGELRGRPAYYDVGATTDIVIRAKDRDGSSRLPPFSIYVAESFPGVMMLNWQAPTQNEDGSPLIDVAGYRIHLGLESGAYGRVVSVPSPHTLNLTITDLPPNTYYVVATAYDTQGLESSYSNEIARQID
jgi:hypothetical protein